jgi:hypothetical protein
MNSGGVEGSIYAGLTGIELPEEQMVFTSGIVLRKTYAHLTAPFLVSFVKPTKQNPIGTPIKAASGGFDFEITTELVVPPQEGSFSAQHLRVLKEVIALLRLWVSPAIRCPICSAVPYSEAQEQPDANCRLIPLEIEPRHFQLKVPMGERVDAKYYEWPMANLARILNLIRNHEELRLALSVIDRGQFIENRALTMVSLWGALEALFLANRGELTFRLASMIASYLEDPGEARHELHRKVVKLYSKRSSAAHGNAKHDDEAVFESFVLLRRVLLKMMMKDAVPSKADFEAYLFGSVPHPGKGPTFTRPPDDSRAHAGDPALQPADDNKA